MKRTDHDKCLYIIHKYILEHPQVFSIERAPSYGIEKGPDLVAHNLCMDLIDYIEVELDATHSKKFKRIAEKAKDLVDKYNKPVRLWLISSSDKWIVGIKKEVRKLGDFYEKKITIKRISPIDIGERRFPF